MMRFPIKVSLHSILCSFLLIIFPSFLIASPYGESYNFQKDIAASQNYSNESNFKSFGYIFLTPGFSPDTNTVVTTKDGHTFTAVGIDMEHKEKVIDVARQLVEDGSQIIELCGGFGPEWITKVQEALGMEVPVGGVYYGPEWRQKLLDILK